MLLLSRLTSSPCFYFFPLAVCCQLKRRFPELKKHVPPFSPHCAHKMKRTKWSFCSCHLGLICLIVVQSFERFSLNVLGGESMHNMQSSSRSLSYSQVLILQKSIYPMIAASSRTSAAFQRAGVKKKKTWSELPLVMSQRASFATAVVRLMQQKWV